MAPCHEPLGTFGRCQFWGPAKRLLDFGRNRETALWRELESQLGGSLAKLLWTQIRERLTDVKTIFGAVRITHVHLFRHLARRSTPRRRWRCSATDAPASLNARPLTAAAHRSRRPRARSACPERRRMRAP